MAMWPFCGYNMGKYFQHWIKMGDKMWKKPRIFMVNWFRKDNKGKFMWPGFGENLRILNWINARCEGKVDAIKTPLGFVPKYEDIDMDGLDYSRKDWNKLFVIDKKEWKKEVKDQKEFLKKFGKDLPKELWEEVLAFEKRIK
jgi:phosphoenolpyruvate carboxykinase (GTP)